ncbi:MAG TPA: hypothetical protein VN645_13530 [Steroidobacteraceae bacterium]|nr:hypothetical protein [Steroidobacteraceae bacterium]
MKNGSLLFTLLRKDLRLFGLFGGLIAALLLLAQFPNLMLQLGTLSGLIQIGLQLGIALLILALCYEDAVVSLKHDWLTRPVPGTTLLLTKTLLVLAVAILPAIVGTSIYNLSQGASTAEALQSGLSVGASGDRVMVFATVMAFAAITANVRQAVIVFLAVLAATAVVTVSFGALREVPESPLATGSGWVGKLTVELLQVLTAACILWIQYRYRRTNVARAIAVMAVIAGMGILMLLTWPVVFGLQKRLSSDPAAAASVQLSVPEGCFPSRVLDGNANMAGEIGARLTALRYTEEHRKAMGAGAIAFSTRLLAQPLPAGQVLVVDHAEVGYYNGSQKLRHLRAGLSSVARMSPINGLPNVDHYWLLPAADAKRFASTAGVETRLDYSLSLLAAKHKVQFAADGQRNHYPGIGYCGANFDRSTGAVAVSCFKPGAQPAMLTAGLEGAADSVISNHRIDFTPAALDFWGGFRHRVQLIAHGTEIPRVEVTVYEARAHFDKQFTVPGVLGGLPSACPVP